MKIAVFGAGAWGTALARAFSASHDICIWSLEAEHVEEMRRTRENRRYFPGFTLPSSISLSSDLAATAEAADLHLIATPLAGLRETVRRIHALGLETPLIWACKGLEADSGKLAHEIVTEETRPDFPFGALTGPSFADEVGRNLPTAVALASFDAAFARKWGNALHQPRLRIYANNDLVGCEIGGAVKNVLAIATGLSDGLGFGLNTRAALLTRGLAEIARLAEALGGQRDTLMGLAGMGDLILTCTGDLSRNRQVGLALAAGKALDTILQELGHVAEGVPTAKAVVRLAQSCGVEMPVCEAVKGVLYDELPPLKAAELLLARDPKTE